MYGDKIYQLLSIFLKYFEKKELKESLNSNLVKKSYDIILFGCHRTGYNILDRLKKNKRILVVDLNPEVISQLKENNINAIYADVSDIEIIKEISKIKTNYVVSTIPSLESNQLITKNFRKEQPKTIIFANAKHTIDCLELYKFGADFVMFPEFLVGHKIADYLTHLKPNGIKKWGKSYYMKFVEDVRSGKLVV